VARRDLDIGHDEVAESSRRRLFLTKGNQITIEITIDKVGDIVTARAEQNNDRPNGSRLILPIV
jgi:hypothetical protein